MPAALITGGGVRIGRAVALGLADAGFDIALHYNDSADDAKSVAEEITAKNVKCTMHQLDFGQNPNFQQFLQDIKQSHPDIELLINNASIFQRCSFLDTDENLFDRHFDINFKAPFFLTQKYAKIIGKGNVINILDSYITRNTGSYFAYLLSKKSLADFTKMAALELGPKIRVNGIALGTILPSDDKIDENYIEKKQIQLPLQKIATIPQIQKQILQIMDNDALTGQIIFLDGGEQLI